MNVFLSCVSQKAPTTCEAQKLYISALFKKSLAYAKTLNPDHIYILSAKYGLLELTDIISPYNQTLKTMTKAEIKKWSDLVYSQMKNKNIDFNERAVFLTGRVYSDPLAKYFSNLEFPLGNLPIGKRLQWYTNKLGQNITSKSKQPEKPIRTHKSLWGEI